MSAQCTCQAGRDLDGAEFGPCAYCEHQADVCAAAELDLQALRRDAAANYHEEAGRVVIYRNDAGVWWTRPADEFHDGRFEALAQASTEGGAS